VNPLDRQTAFDGRGEQALLQPGGAYRVERVLRPEPEAGKVEVEVGGSDQIGEFGAMGVVEGVDEGGPDGVRGRRRDGAGGGERHESRIAQ